MKISVVINTFNSDRFLNQCLRSVEKFDEIVLCDMHSTDGTIAIAEKYGCRIVYHERTGIVEPARNYAIAQAENEWVLVLDSDEVVPDALREYLYRFAETAEQRGYAALKMARKNYFLGRFMHGDIRHSEPSAGIGGRALGQRKRLVADRQDRPLLR